MARVVHVQRRAAADIAGAVVSLTDRVSIASADRWRRRVEAAVLALADDADQWPEADEAADLGINLRCRLVGRRPHMYRVLFTLDDAAVFVVRVYHAARDRLTADDL